MMLTKNWIFIINFIHEVPLLGNFWKNSSCAVGIEPGAGVLHF